MVHFARVPGLDDQRHLRPLLRPDQVVVHRGHREQRRDRRPQVVGVAVRDHQGSEAVRDRLARGRPEVLDGLRHSLTARVRPVQRPQHRRRETRAVPVRVDVDDPRQLVVVEHRPRQHDLPTRRGRGFEQILLGAHHAAQRRHDLLPDRIQRRVGDLREQFDEVVVEQPGPLRQDGDRGVGAHRTDRFAAGRRHRRQQDALLFRGVAEGELSSDHRLVVVGNPAPPRQGTQVEQTGVQPVRVRLLRREFCLHLAVGHESPGLGVDEEHLPRLEPALLDHLGLRDRQHAALAGQHHSPVASAPPSAGTQSVAVENRTDDRAVGECDAGRAVPRFHQRRMELVEPSQRRGHVRVVLPGLGDHHQYGVWQ